MRSAFVETLGAPGAASVNCLDPNVNCLDPSVTARPRELVLNLTALAFLIILTTLMMMMMIIIVSLS